MKQYIRRKQGFITALLLTIWSSIVVLAIYLDIANEREQIEMLLLDQGRLLSMFITTQWRWNAQHGGIFVPADSTIQPNPYIDESNRIVIASDGQRLVNLSHTWMLQELGKLTNIGPWNSMAVVSTDPLNPANRADAWETGAIDKFRQAENGVFGPPPEMFRIDSRELRYISPLKAKTSCLACHRSNQFTPGSTIGGLRLTIDAEPFMEWSKRENVQHISVLVIIWIIGCSGIMMIMRAISRRITEEIKLHRFKGVLEMAGSAAHELNQPLQIISGYAELLSVVDADSRDEMNGMLLEIRQNIQRLALVTRKLNNITCYKTMKLSGNDRIIDLEQSASDTEPIYPSTPPETV